MSNEKTQTSISGDLSIHTQNIFPIIKKWLYSEHDIFMRELLSNSFDAIKKRKKIALKEQNKSLETEGLIEVTFDEKTKTVHILDNGQPNYHKTSPKRLLTILLTIISSFFGYTYYLILRNKFE